MEIQNASTTPSKSNQLRYVNTILWDSRNITTQPVGIDDRKSDVIAFVVNAGITATTANRVFLYMYIVSRRRDSNQRPLTPYTHGQLRNGGIYSKCSQIETSPYRVILATGPVNLI